MIFSGASVSRYGEHKTRRVGVVAAVSVAQRAQIRGQRFGAGFVQANAEHTGTDASSNAVDGESPVMR